MLKKEYRASRIDITSTIKNGRTAPGRLVYAKYASASSPHSHFAVVVSKKAQKTSVGRHRLKRQMSAAIEKYTSLEASQPSFTIVFFAQPQEPSASYRLLEENIRNILETIGFLKKK